MKHLITASRLTKFQRCARAHHYRYEIGVAPMATAPALAFGTAIHAALEAFWRAWMASGYGSTESALDALESCGLDPLSLVKARVMVAAYCARYMRLAARSEVLAVEVEFSCDLIDPDTGVASVRWRLAGKIDAIIRLPDGRVAIVEHKCLAGDARIFDHATGTYETARDLYERGTAPVVTAMWERGNLGTTQALPLRLAAVRPVYRVATLGGRALRVSGNHPVFTARGWVYAADLTTDDWVGAPRHLASATPDAPISDEAVRLIGYMIGDGSMSNMSLTKGDPAVIDDVLRCALAEGEAGKLCRPEGHVTYVRFSLAGPVKRVMDRAGFTKKTLSADKRLPFHLALSDRQVGQLVGALWSTDGCIDTFRGRKLRIVYTSVSQTLCVDIQHALQRLGIVSNVRTSSVEYKGERRPVTQVQVVSRESKRRFLSLAIESVIPVLRAKVMPRDAVAFIPTSKQGGDDRGRPAHHPHLWWDRVESVEVQGEEQTYDLEVPDAHTFVVDGIVTHNTSAKDASAGSDYRARLTLDAQVGIYFDGAEALGYAPDLCLYDVLVKPSQEPMMATPEEDRRYTAPKSRACKECSRKKGAPGPHFDEAARVYCKDGRVTTDAGHLYANQRAEDETPDEFAARLCAVVAADPDRYLVQAELVRTTEERDDCRRDVVATVRAIELTRKTGYAPRSAQACFAHGRCEYLDACHAPSLIDDPYRYRRLPIHSELSEVTQPSNPTEHAA